MSVVTLKKEGRKIAFVALKSGIVIKLVGSQVPRTVFQLMDPSMRLGFNPFPFFEHATSAQVILERYWTRFNDEDEGITVPMEFMGITLHIPEKGGEFDFNYRSMGQAKDKENMGRLLACIKRVGEPRLFEQNVPRAMAVAMGAHPRLGAVSMLSCLDKEILALICNFQDRILGV
jgi:hypothetical protein